METPKSVNRFMFWFFLWFVLPVQILMAIGAAGLVYFCRELSDSFYMVNIMILQDLLLMLIPILFYGYLKRDCLYEILPLKKLTGWNICYIIFIGFLMIPVMSFISVVTSLFYPNDTADITETILTASPVVGFIVMAVSPALFEETIFRGFVFGGLKKFGAAGAVVLSAFYFGLFHMDLYQIPYAMFAGCIMALVVYYTGSLFASMLLHLVINGTQVIAYYCAVSAASSAQISEELAEAEETAAAMSDIIGYGITAVIFGVLLFLMIKGFIRYNKKRYDFEPIEPEKGHRLIDGWFLGAVVICILYLTACELFL
ncbi:MAG: CPBP family intramembrane metalloprotease [Clostridiales bacterium]|nr:CPBP family intramembrane metalloprotease [Clostridiales bacterium]